MLAIQKLQKKISHVNSFYTSGRQNRNIIAAPTTQMIEGTAGAVTGAGIGIGSPSGTGGVNFFYASNYQKEILTKLHETVSMPQIDLAPPQSPDHLSQMIEIKPNLWLGGQAAGSNKALLTKHGIKHILRIGKNCDKAKIKSLQYFEVGIETLVDDGQDVNILQYFMRCIAYIKKCLGKQEPVLVHCDRGISIAPTVMVAYLIKEHGLTLKRAFETLYVEKRYYQANIGRNFWIQLYLFQQKVREMVKGDKKRMVLMPWAQQPQPAHTFRSGANQSFQPMGVTLNFPEDYNFQGRVNPSDLGFQNGPAGGNNPDQPQKIILETFEHQQTLEIDIEDVNNMQAKRKFSEMQVDGLKLHPIQSGLDSELLTSHQNMPNRLNISSAIEMNKFNTQQQINKMQKTEETISHVQRESTVLGDENQATPMTIKKRDMTPIEDSNDITSKQKQQILEQPLKIDHMSDDGSEKSQTEEKIAKKSFNQQTSLRTLDQTMKGSLSFAQISNKNIQDNNSGQNPKIIEIQAQEEEELTFEEKLFRDLDQIGRIVAKEKRWDGSYDLPRKVPSLPKYFTRNASPRRDLMTNLDYQSSGDLQKSPIKELYKSPTKDLQKSPQTQLRGSKSISPITKQLKMIRATSEQNYENSMSQNQILVGNKINKDGTSPERRQETSQSELQAASVDGKQQQLASFDSSRMEPMLTHQNESSAEPTIDKTGKKKLRKWQRMKNSENQLVSKFSSNNLKMNESFQKMRVDGKSQQIKIVNKELEKFSNLHFVPMPKDNQIKPQQHIIISDDQVETNVDQVTTLGKKAKLQEILSLNIAKNPSQTSDGKKTFPSPEGDVSPSKSNDMQKILKNQRYDGVRKKQRVEVRADEMDKVIRTQSIISPTDKEDMQNMSPTISPNRNVRGDDYVSPFTTRLSHEEHSPPLVPKNRTAVLTNAGKLPAVTEKTNIPTAENAQQAKKTFKFTSKIQENQEKTMKKLQEFLNRPVLPVQSLYLQNFEAQIALEKLKEQSEHTKAASPSPSSRNNDKTSNSRLKNQRNTISYTRKQSVSSVLSALPIAGQLKPQHLTKVGGLPLNSEALAINEKLREAVILDPMCKIRGSRAHLQAQFLEMRSFQTSAEKHYQKTYPSDQEKSIEPQKLPQLTISNPLSPKTAQNSQMAQEKSKGKNVSLTSKNSHTKKVRLPKSKFEKGRQRNQDLDGTLIKNASAKSVKESDNTTGLKSKKSIKNLPDIQTNNNKDKKSQKPKNHFDNRARSLVQDPNKEPQTSLLPKIQHSSPSMRSTNNQYYKQQQHDANPSTAIYITAAENKEQPQMPTNPSQNWMSSRYGLQFQSEAGKEEGLNRRDGFTSHIAKNMFSPKVVNRANFQHQVQKIKKQVKEQGTARDRNANRSCTVGEVIRSPSFHQASSFIFQSPKYSTEQPTQNALNALQTRNQHDSSIQRLEDVIEQTYELNNFDTVDKDLKELITIKQNMLDQASSNFVFFKGLKEHVKLQRHHNKNRQPSTIEKHFINDIEHTNANWNHKSFKVRNVKVKIKQKVLDQIAQSSNKSPSKFRQRSTLQLNKDLMDLSSPMRIHPEASLSNILGTVPINQSSMSSEDPSSPQFHPNWVDARLAHAPILAPDESQQALAEMQSKIRASELHYFEKSLNARSQLKVQISERNSEIHRVSPKSDELNQQYALSINNDILNNRANMISKASNYSRAKIESQHHHIPQTRIESQKSLSKKQHLQVAKDAGVDSRLDMQSQMGGSKQGDRESRLHQISGFENEPASPGLLQYDKGGATGGVAPPGSLERSVERSEPPTNTKSPKDLTPADSIQKQLQKTQMSKDASEESYQNQA